MLDKLPRDILLLDILELLDINDESIWKKLCLQEFNISPDHAYRNKGWKSFYEALTCHTKVYTWGENFDSRLGLDYPASNDEQDSTLVMRPIFRHHRRMNRRYPREVTTPQEVHSLENRFIIDIASGGWSFHALDISGSVYMWGTMQQDITIRSSYGTKRLTTPTLLQTGNETQTKVKFRSISSGRGHVIGLAREGTVWHWSNHVTLQRVDIEDRIVQVAANWNYSSALTENGELLVIPKPDLIIQSQLQVEPTPTVLAAGAVSVKDLISDASSANDSFVQIAGLDGYTIALTRHGRVLKVTTRNGFATEAIELIKYSSETKENNERHGVMKRFITGAFNHFAVYTKDMVMMGDVDVTAETEPTRIDALDHQDICKVSFGDYHYGALTNQGKLLTWGKNSSGALGHGDNTEDMCPTPRIVESLNNSFVFAIGFGGWQSSVLAIANMQ